MQEVEEMRGKLEELAGQSPMSREVVCMAAFLGSAPLPSEFALHIEGGMHSPVLINPAAAVFAVAATLDPLYANDLAVAEEDSMRFVVPDDVREAVRAALPEEEHLDWASRASYVLNLCLPDAEPGNWVQAEPLMPHVRKCLDMVEMGVRSAALNRVLHQTGFFLFGQESFDDAIVFLEAALVVDVAIKGELHPDIASDHEGLGMVRLAAGDGAKAEHHFNTCIDIRKKLFTENNPILAPAYDGLAYAMLAQGKEQDAVKQWQIAADIMEAATGADNPFVVQCRENADRYRA